MMRPSAVSTVVAPRTRASPATGLPATSARNFAPTPAGGSTSSGPSSTCSRLGETPCERTWSVPPPSSSRVMGTR